MEATFDNKTNLLSANIRSSVDNSILYTASTSHNLWGRTVTILKDANPALGFGDSNLTSMGIGGLGGGGKKGMMVVGAIYWRERLFEVNGVRRNISDLKRKNRFKGSGSIRSGGGHGHVSQSGKERKRGKENAKYKEMVAAEGVNKRKNEQGSEKEKERKKGRERKDSMKRMSIISTTSSLSVSSILGQGTFNKWWRKMNGNVRYWKWGTDRTEYEVVYDEEEWKAMAIFDKEKESLSLSGRHHHRGRRIRVKERNEEAGKEFDGEHDDNSDENTAVAARLYVPYRNHLFHRTKPAVLRMSQKALLQDEVFLLLALIYSETKRQDKTNSSVGW